MEGEGDFNPTSSEIALDLLAENAPETVEGLLQRILVEIDEMKQTICQQLAHHRAGLGDLRRAVGVNDIMARKYFNRVIESRRITRRKTGPPHPRDRIQKRKNGVE